jgi:hypothetical protein
MSISRTLAIATVVVFLATPAAAKFTKCRLAYNATGWSILYKQYKGSGRVTCENGESADVSIVSHGGGITLGSSKITDGRGTFSGAHDISEIFGTYVSADAHAGAVWAADSHAMIKGGISLVLTGTGDGVNLGFSFGGFTIRRK